MFGVATCHTQKVSGFDKDVSLVSDSDKLCRRGACMSETHQNSNNCPIHRTNTNTVIVPLQEQLTASDSLTKVNGERNSPEICQADTRVALCDLIGPQVQEYAISQWKPIFCLQSTNSHCNCFLWETSHLSERNLSNQVPVMALMVKSTQGSKNYKICPLRKCRNLATALRCWPGLSDQN